ncbi:TPA: hypothetical protein DIC40_06040 [Patescibacteria group bacterium]|nr:hypothetical protein [Candidatus Gracilibacteria bacterium]
MINFIFSSHQICHKISITACLTSAKGSFTKDLIKSTFSCHQIFHNEFNKDNFKERFSLSLRDLMNSIVSSHQISPKIVTKELNF